MKESEIKVVIKKPRDKMQITTISNTLENFQHIVDGYIECIRPLKNKKIVAVLNDFGKYLDFEPNFVYAGTDVVVGNVIFTKSTVAGDFVSLTEQDIKQIEKFLEREAC